jgi:hypothetical protein
MAGPLKKDKWYEDHGVQPPEHITHQGSDSVKPDIHLHHWQARGNFLHCDQGQNAHGIPYDHLNKLLVGTDSHGAPIFKPIVLSNKVPKVDTNTTRDTVEARA